MLEGAIDLTFNVTHALQIVPPDYIRSILGEPDSWSPRTCPPTELRLAETRESAKGLPALAHILLPAVPWKPPGVSLPFSDLLFRPSVMFRYPTGAPDPTLQERWFFINGICTDRSVVQLNADYIFDLFGRPLTVLHNYTRSFLPDLIACAVGKEWDRVTESAAVAVPPIYSALKNPGCERVILLAHSQGTIISAVVLEFFKGLYRPAHDEWMEAPPTPERAVAHKLAERWEVSVTMKNVERAPGALPRFPWPGHGLRHLEPVTLKELQKLEIYCFANCATEMLPVKARAPWIESYGNEMDIVARLGVLAAETGPGSVRIGGDRYVRNGAWGHLLNAHYLYPMMKTRDLTPLKGNRLNSPRLFEYLGGESPQLLSDRSATRASAK